MSNKHAKLIRYFLKAKGDPRTAEMIRKAWPHLSAKAKGLASKHLREWCATSQAMRVARKASNLQMLENFLK